MGQSLDLETDVLHFPPESLQLHVFVVDTLHFVCNYLDFVLTWDLGVVGVCFCSLGFEGKQVLLKLVLEFDLVLIQSDLLGVLLEPLLLLLNPFLFLQFVEHPNVFGAEASVALDNKAGLSGPAVHQAGAGFVEVSFAVPTVDFGGFLG